MFIIETEPIEIVPPLEPTILEPAILSICLFFFWKEDYHKAWQDNQKHLKNS